MFATFNYLLTNRPLLVLVFLMAVLLTVCTILLLLFSHLDPASVFVSALLTEVVTGCLLAATNTGR